MVFLSNLPLPAATGTNPRDIKNPTFPKLLLVEIVAKATFIKKFNSKFCLKYVKFLEKLWYLNRTIGLLFIQRAHSPEHFEMPLRTNIDVRRKQTNRKTAFSCHLAKVEVHFISRQERCFDFVMVCLAFTPVFK